MADGIPTKPPTFQTKNWGALVRQSWGDDWHKPEIAYRFSNARTFNDSGANHGIYNVQSLLYMQDGYAVDDYIAGE